MSLRNLLLGWAAALGAALPGCTLTSSDVNPDPPCRGADWPDPHQPGKVERADYREKPAPPPEPAHLAPSFAKGAAGDDPPALLRPAAQPDEPVGRARPLSPPLPEARAAADEPLVTALRAFLRKRSPEALDALGRYPKANQELLLVALPFAARLTEGDIDRASPREAAELADLLQGAEERLRLRAALRIDKALFCRKIDGFGDYVAREPAAGDFTFEAGAGDQPGELMQVYAELGNVSGRRQGPYVETSLVGRIEIVDFEGRSVYRQDFRPRGRSLSPKHDFFVSWGFCVPPRVPPGRYTLHVEVRDVTGLPAGAATKEAPPYRVASQALHFRVVPPRPERTAAAR